ncbi:VanZ family protein [Paenibacillus hamazuiensis]|uniref:VanZ family protein n=1 Tax=Paenibacillus hamazuiensis TaxID=2936508 RepID=UPI00200DD269|nr:VanZ family protein [Paenibacillus hamazuiensis]
MKKQWKLGAWLMLMLDIVITLKYTWLRESVSFMYAQLMNVRTAAVWTYLDSEKCNLVPFRTIGYYLFDSSHAWTSIVNLGGNVAAFMPIGFLIPLLSAKRKSSLWSIAAISFGYSLLIETGQLLMEIGAFDVDDLILNTLGGCAGLMVLKVFIRIAFPSSVKLLSVNR